MQGAHCGYKETIMWYFAWILGVLLALAAGVINVMWLESEQCLGELGDDSEGGDRK
jgi:cyd operon protein YbgT